MARKSRCESMKFKVHKDSSNGIEVDTRLAIIHGRNTMIRLIAESIHEEIKSLSTPVRSGGLVEVNRKQ